VPLRFEVRTPRLVIRPFRLDDAAELFEAVNASRTELSPWVPWAAKDHRVLAQSAAFVARNVLACDDGAILQASGLSVAMTDAGTGRLVGGTGFHDLRPATASAEVGYWMRSDASGRGLCTEGVAYFLSWLFTPPGKAIGEGGLGLRRVRVYVAAPNQKSVRVVHKLGLREEVRQRDDLFAEGVGVVDRLGWGVMADEWDRDLHRVRHSAPATPAQA
jgi:ribosomal-protein-serine acetyltransferase